MNRSIVGLSILLLIVEVPLWLHREDPYHRFGFILSLTGIIVLIVGLAIQRKARSKKIHINELLLFNQTLSTLTKGGLC
jgi:uncharacterized transporter YbjL